MMIASTQTNSPLAGIPNQGAPSPSLLDLAVTRMKAAGLRVTRPRVAILTALSRQAAPTSIDQIHAEVGAATCDLVTVYRCMGAFERIDLVRRGFFHNGTARFHLNLGRPQNLQLFCRRTNQAVELDPATSAELQRFIDAAEETLRARGYTEVSHSIEFFGTPPVAAGSSAPGATSTR